MSRPMVTLIACTFGLGLARGATRVAMPRAWHRAMRTSVRVLAAESDSRAQDFAVRASAAAADDDDDDADDDDAGAPGARERPWKRPRQHVNPLATHHQRPINLPADFDARTFSVPRPLHIDIGCASGHFCVQLADASAGARNVLGLEIRAPLVERANGWADARPAGNLRFLACNANVDLPAILTACRSPLASVSIQFPDPWFKKRHHKRRVVQPELVEHIATGLPVGGTLFVQSDVQELAEAMREQIELTAGDRLKPAPGPAGDGWLDHNPTGIPTEREIATYRKGGSVWRALYTRV